MAQPHEVLQASLQQRVGFETVQNNAGPKQVRFFGRVRPANMPTWLQAMHDLLARSEGAPWSIDLSRQYFLRGDKIFFGWRIIIQSEAIGPALAQIVDVIQRVQVVTPQVEEVKLHARADRNTLRNGRGAQPLSTTTMPMVGPIAKQMLGM